MWDKVLQIIMAGVGTLGFSLYFHVKTRNLVAATVGGILSWICYLIVFEYSDSIFLANMISAMLVCTWAEIMARVMKAPANIFLITGIIPLLPGSSLYYTMSALLEQKMKLFEEKGSATVLSVIGISVGIVFGAVVFTYFVEVYAHLKDKKNNE